MNDVVYNASMALKIGVDLAFGPRSPLEFGYFDKKYLGRPTVHGISCSVLCLVMIVSLKTGDRSL